MKSEPTTLVITDDNHLIRNIFNTLDKGSRKGKENSSNVFYFTTFKDKKKNALFSTNGHLQVFQNSSMYKWAGLDPRKIIEDENSVIPVLNSFNKKIYYALQKFVETENVDDCILAMTPDVNALTIGLKEVKNLLVKSKFNHPIKKMFLFSLDAKAIIDGLSNASEFTFEDERAAEIEYLRSYLDAIISFSTTQEITYTIKRCIDMNSPAFKELKDILRHDMKESKNLLIPMSRAQALNLMWIYDNNNAIHVADNVASNVSHLIYAKLKRDDGSLMDVRLNGKIFSNLDEANAFLQKAKGERHARIDGITSKDIVVQPPSMYDLTGIVEQISEEMGFPATYTYKILLDLYYFKFITYPSPDRMNVNDLEVNHENLMDIFSEIDEIEDIAKKARDNFHDMKEADVEVIMERSRNRIIPLSAQAKNSPFFETRANHWKIFSAIARRYLLQFIRPAIVAENKISFKIKKIGQVSISSFKIKDEGFAQYTKEPVLSEYKAFDFNVLKSIEITEYHEQAITRPKAFYTDASLLKEIKGKNIGDTVSYLLMIEKLITNNYIQVINKNLKLTKRGELIAQFLKETFDFLGDIEFTNFFMHTMQDLEAIQGKDAFTDRLENAKKTILSEYLERFTRARDKTNDYLLKQGVNLTAFSESAYDTEQKKRFTTTQELHLFCSCGSPMKIIETKTKTRFLACENRLGCGKTAGLPREGKITVIDKACDACGKNVLMMESAERGTYFFCPTCWTQTYSRSAGESLGYCVTCEKENECWTPDKSSTHYDTMQACIAQHEDGVDKCPRCQKSRMIILPGDDASTTTRFICENPFCNYFIEIPRLFADSLEKTEKKCLICPMNAVLFKREGKAFYVCPNCYSQHLRKKEEQIGFCMGCSYHDACFNNEMKPLNVRVNVRESVKKRLAESSGEN